MKTSMARFAVLAAVVACLPALLLGQKAGVITKYVQPAMVVQPPARPGLQEVSTSLTGSNIPVKWHDVLRTDIGGRIRAQLNDGSILSIGSKSQLIVQKHDEKAQQSAFDLSYGKVRTQVVKLARPDSSFEVRTATAVCGVLGTDDIVDAENPTATVVIVISGVVVVRSSDPRVVGSVQLTAGQTTTVTAGQPPTQPTAATAVQVSGAVLGTSGSVDPDPTVASLPPSLTAGSPLLLDGRSSTGGLGSIASYSWSFTPNPFVNGLQQPNLSDSFLDLNTTGWPAGNYVGRLTVTNTAGRTATVTFQFAVVAAPAVPPPDATVNALAAAYETLQVRSFMNLFDPVKYNGYAALEQSITQSFANIQTNRVFVQKAAGQTQGNSAILQVNFTIRFTPKVTALASPGVAPPPMRAFARGGAAATGSISGSAGAVQTQVVVSGPLTETVLSPNNSLNYTAPNLPDGTYTVTPMRTAFVFTPSSRTVVVANGAAVTGVDFSAQPLEQTVTEQATLRMELEGDKGWMITDIQGGLGSAGLVGIPGTNTATGINSPGSGSGNGMIIPGTPSFTVTSPATYTVVQGGSNAATPALITVNGTNGFSGPVTITFPSTPGVSIVSGPPTITVPPGGITAAASYVFAFSPTVTGLTAVPYLATAGSITQSAFIAFQIQTLSLNVTGPGQTAGTGLQLFSGNSASTSLLLVSNPPGFNGSATYTTQPSVGGINAAVVAGANGAATLNVTSTDSNSGPFQIVVSAKTASGAVVSTTVFVNRFPPITSGLSLTPPNLTIAQGQPGNYVVNVPFNSGYVLSATIVPPTLPNVTFVPVNPLPNASGKVTLTQTGTATFQVLTNSTTFTNPSGDFVISAGAFQALVHTTVTLNPPFDFTIAASGTTLAQGTLANVSVAVAQVTGSGAGPLPVTISIGALPTGISANVISGGTINGTGSAVINVGAAANAPLGTTSFLVTGTAGGVTHSATVSVTVTSTGSFTLTTTPATVNAPEGGVGSVTVGVTAIGGFSDPVTITAASTVAQVAGPGTITPGSSAPYSITATGAGTITFTGSTAAMSQTASVAVALVPGFSLTAPSGQGFPGGTTTITVAISRLFPAFTAPVTITASSSGATFTQSTVTTTGNSADFVVNIPPTATGAISVSFSGVVQGGKLTVPASSSISLAAPFSLTGSAVSGFAGQSVPVVIPVTRNGSFTGAVTVTAAAGIPGAIVTPSSVTVQPGQTSAAFVVTIPAGATSGSIIFNGTAVGQTTSATVTITIGAPFTISAGSNLGVIVPGGSVQTTVTIGFAQSFNGPVVLTVGVVGTATASISPTSLSAAGTAQLTVSAPAGAGAGSSSITVTAASGSFTLTSVYVINTAQIPLTISANSKTRVFGAPNPTFDATFSGFVAPDGPQSLSGALACATAANVSSPVGSYQINCAGLSSTKYAITYSPGTLTVTIAGSTTSLASSTNPANVGQNVTLTATVSAVSPATGNPTGIVTFKDGSTVLGPGNLAGGQATLNTSFTSGSHSLTAVYAGDTNFTGSASSPVNEMVGMPVTIQLASGTNPSTFGQSVTFTATVTPSAATGTIQFRDGSTLLGSPVPMSAGVAQFQISTLNAGSGHLITASYSGDSIYSSGVSSALPQTVNKANSSVVIASSLNPSTYGQQVTFTATVTPSTATGAATFFDGSTQLGSPVTLSGGVAAINVSTLNAAGHTITATYNGDANYNGSSTQTPVSQTVGQATPVITLVPSSNPSIYGQALTLTATVGPAPATGTVSFLDSEITISGVLNLVNNRAVLNISTLGGGTHNLSVNYSGDSNILGATFQASFTETINTAPTTTVVVASVNPSGNGQQVTFTATVTPNAATGNVSFFDGTSPLVSAVALVNGSAQFATSGLAVGNHPITVQYSGDFNYSGSTSTVLTQAVGLAPSTTVVTLTNGPNPSTFGQALTFMAAVTPNSATGTVQFKDGSSNVGTPVNIATGAAAIVVSTLGASATAHSITAVYSGDSLTLPSTSAAISQTVNQAASTITVQSNQNPSTYGQTVIFTATVPTAATGAVTFKDGSSTLGTGSANNGSATFQTSSLMGGSHSITAVYGGDTNFTGSTSSSLPQMVNLAASSTTLSSSVNPSSGGQSVMFTATVTTVGATGTITFKDGATILNPTPIGLDVNRQVVLAISTLSVSTHSITAAYSGDVNFAGSTSTPVSQVVNAATATVSLGSNSNPSTYGQSVTFTGSVLPANATGTMTLKDGGTPVGSPVALSGGSAQFPTLVQNAGSHSMTVSYSGDSTFGAATSTTLTQTVNQAPLTVTASNATMVQGSSVPSLTGTYSGFVNGDSASVLSGTLTCVTTATSSSAPGGYPITCSGQTAANYTITYVQGTLTVTTATGGVVSAGSASGIAAGGVAGIPVSLTLNGGATLDSLSFGLRITPNGSAPAITSGTLNFTASGLPTPSFVDPNAGPNVISVSWLHLSPAISGNVNLGTVTFTVPAGTTTGQTYTVTITGASGSLNNSNVPVVPGGTGTVTAASLSGRLSAFSFTPAVPREGDSVVFRAHIPNPGAARTVTVAVVSGDKTLVSQRADLRAGRDADLELTWQAQRLSSRDLNVTVDGQTISTVRNFALDRAGSSTYDHMTLLVRNDACSGVRLAGGSQSSCGGSSDIEVYPSITANGGLEVRLAMPDGGIRDLGPMALASATIPDRGSLASQALFEEGHTYLVKTRNQLALLRVTRIRSSINPRFAVQPGRPRGARPTNTDVLGQIRDQERTDHLLNSAQISIDLEWRTEP